MAEILHQLIGSLTYYLHGFIHPGWCRISAINSSTRQMTLDKLFTPRLSWKMILFERGWGKLVTMLLKGMGSIYIEILKAMPNLPWFCNKWFFFGELQRFSETVGGSAGSRRGAEVYWSFSIKRWCIQSRT